MRCGMMFANTATHVHPPFCVLLIARHERAKCYSGCMSFAEDTNDNTSASKTSLPRKAIALGVVAVLALICCVYSLGRYVTLPFPLSVTTDTITAESHTSDAGVIVDDFTSRVIFLNGDAQVVNILEPSRFDADSKIYYCACVYDGSIYVTELSYFYESTYIDTERIVRFSANGEALETVLEYQYDRADNAAISPRINQIYFDEGGGHALVFNQNRDTASMVSFPATLEGGRSAVTLDDAPEYTFAQLPENGTMYSVIYKADEALFTAFDVFGNSYIYSGTVDTRDTITLETDETDASWISTTLPREVMCQEHEGDLLPHVSVSYYTDTYDQSNFDFAPALTVRIVTLWLSIAYLIVLAVVMGARAICKQDPVRRRTTFRKVLLVVVAVVCATTIALFYSINMRTQTEEAKQQELVSVVTTMETCVHDQLVSVIEEFTENDVLSMQTYQNTASLLKTNSHQIDQGYSYAYFALLASINDETYLLAASGEDTLTGKMKFDASHEDVANGETTANTSDASTIGISDIEWGLEDTVGAFREITNDEGVLLGYLVATYDHQAFDAESLSVRISLLIALLTAFVMASLLIGEGKSLYDAAIERRRLQKQKVPHPEYTYARAVAFLAIATTSTGSAISSLVAKEMLAGTSIEGTAVLYALPEVALTAGIILSSLSYALLMHRYPTRTIIMIAGISLVAFYTLCAVCVSANNLFLFAIMLFFASFDIQIIFLRAIDLAELAPSTMRGSMNRQIANAVISGSSLSTLLAGILAERLGNGYIYVLAAVLGLICVGVTLVATPRKHTQDATACMTAANTTDTSITADVSDDVISSSNTKQNDRGTSVLKLLQHPAIICALLCIIVVSISAGYKSFLFPLFASDQGLDKTAISTISVFCGTLVFYLAPLTSSVETKVGNRTMLVGSMLCLAITFGLFFVNSSMAWAVIALFLSTLLYKINQPINQTFVQAKCEELGAKSSTCTSLYGTLSNVGSLVRSPLFGGLLVLGSASACVVVGILLAIVAAAFSLVTSPRKSRK